MIILCWNRDYEDAWPMDDFESCRLACEGGDVVKGDWSVGNHVNIDIGTECFMLIQGQEHPRGLVARGYTISLPEERQHWRDPEKTTNYVDVYWHSIRSFMDPIPTEALDEELPDVPWLTGIQGSGFPIKGENQEKLREVWNEYV
jgi:hypothetical protein